jgi:uncharacterized protein with HEPN domain
LREAFARLFGGRKVDLVPPQVLNNPYRPEITWAGSVAFRNVLDHKYGAVDYQRLYAVLSDDLPGLITALEAILASLEG